MDKLKQLGKSFKSTDDEVDYALARPMKSRSRIERVRDVIDSFYSFRMKFSTHRENQRVMMDLIFDTATVGPSGDTGGGTSGCFNNICPTCEEFVPDVVYDAGEYFITTTHPYISGSVKVHVNALTTNDTLAFTEIGPSQGLIRIDEAVTTTDIITVCYNYRIGEALECSDHFRRIVNGSLGYSDWGPDWKYVYWYPADRIFSVNGNQAVINNLYFLWTNPVDGTSLGNDTATYVRNDSPFTLPLTATIKFKFEQDGTWPPTVSSVLPEFHFKVAEFGSKNASDIFLNMTGIEIVYSRLPVYSVDLYPDDGRNNMSIYREAEGSLGLPLINPGTYMYAKIEITDTSSRDEAGCWGVRGKVWSENDTEPDWLIWGLDAGLPLDVNPDTLLFTSFFLSQSQDVTDAKVYIDWIKLEGDCLSSMIIEPTILYFDDFNNRTVSSGWGISSLGYTWIWSYPEAEATPSVSDGIGRIVSQAGTTAYCDLYVENFPYFDGDFWLTFKVSSVPSEAPLEMAVEWYDRQNPTTGLINGVTTWRFGISTSSTPSNAYMQLQGTYGSPDEQFIPKNDWQENTWYILRGYRNGSTGDIKLKIWEQSTSEPEVWNAEINIGSFSLLYANQFDIYILDRRSSGPNLTLELESLYFRVNS